ncbi:MAG: RNA methyltransferase [Gemmatimonadetes bacterium]|nr:RNA methyltransferase [Gemmatimonadota bacterium]
MNNDPAAASSRLLTLARDLKRRKARERNSLFVAEGVRAVEELVRSGVPMHGVLTTDDLRTTERGAALVGAIQARSVDCTSVSDKDFRSAAGTDSPQGILAIAEVPVHAIDEIEPAVLARALVLDSIQDPGNVGTLIRTAAALGIRSVIALPGTVDPWNAKVVRSGAGGHFHVIVTKTEPQDLFAALRAADVALWGADASGTPVGALTAPPRLALAVGNEGAGLTPAVRGAAVQLVSLPMAAGVESFNVAVAAGILLYALAP